MTKAYSDADLQRLERITEKRPATVIRHLLKYGSITTEELETIYGYKHPPRAIRDVRERGINIETFRTVSSEGRRIGAYRFGKPLFMEDQTARSAGRTALSQVIKRTLIEKYGARCMVYNQQMDERLLQVDHRIPYEIGGEGDEKNCDVYMLLSPSANRLKSWTCEHCSNWVKKDTMVCMNCFWAHPEHYTHIAGKPERHIILTFTGEEVKDYDRLVIQVGTERAEAVIKELIRRFLGE